ncbi:MAG: hypothetical protein Q9166_003665 [cf. Caloplaca sp. 2 TL-2023]
MTAFSATGFLCDNEDKGFEEYFAQTLEEPFNDFFDRYLTHTVSAEPNEFDYPDLFTDGETLTDSTSTASSQSRYNNPQGRNHKSLSKTAFRPQNYQSHPRREKLQPAVSGLELLRDIEGQADRRPQASDPPHLAPATTTTLPLRRKPRFRTSKSINLHSNPVDQTSEHSNSIMRPLYNYRRESPQPQEWMHGLEHLSLDSGVSQFSTSSSTVVVPPFHDGSATTFHTPRHMTLRDEFFQGERHGDQGVHTSFDSSLQSQTEPFDPFGQVDGNIPYASTMAPHQLHQSPSWAPSVSASSEATYILSSNHRLPDSTDSYYTNGLASQSAPTLPYQLETHFSMKSFGAASESAGAPIHDDVPPNPIPLPQRSKTAYPDPPTLPQEPPAEPSDSPPRRISSPPALPHTPRTHRRSKSAAPRRKSAGNLRTPKSSASTSMGFVNFTPQDSKRILTGVAPSGSSKTKARREQEANEKKRKLSAAVLRALEEAGGDTEGLKREGLLVDG